MKKQINISINFENKTYNAYYYIDIKSNMLTLVSEFETKSATIRNTPHDCLAKLLFNECLHVAKINNKIIC